MEDYEISNSLDWNRVKTMLYRSKKSVRIFSSDIDRMINNIEKEVKVLGNLEVVARNKKTESSIKTAQLQLDKVNLTIKNFNKYYMLALLTHE
jgi:ribosomal protein L13